MIQYLFCHEHHGHKSSLKQESSYGYDIHFSHTGEKSHHEVPVHHHQEEQHAQSTSNEHHYHHEAAVAQESHKHEPTHEPHYEFGYTVHDPHTHDIKSQKEERYKDHVKGEYTLVEPDGHKRIVEYTADKHSGFNAHVRREHEHHHAASVAQESHHHEQSASNEHHYHHEAAVGHESHKHEPTHVPHYEFGYTVHDPKTHDVKSQKEERYKDHVKGEYTLVEPDGHKRIVEYTADKHSGFNAHIRREPIHHY
ncbi:histidine-rich glycoprotein-like [Agrilus planipennis]|uniref:Histidine-rich glycoprotein-like n=1 Tax=Agrilus planipennis TaxID=224129 RepID=A0A7F5QYB4_AGRPL|nr:histidine-rich glycoprotein-like [Agrilus planipennis]